jgi:inorganic pyrophosphatase
MTNLAKLPPYDDGALRVIVESPRGASIKPSYERSLRMFTISRALPLGVVYPFDWGFIPGTRGDDGDALDAMAVHNAGSYPGVLLTCRILGMVEVIQREGKGKPKTNNRIIATALAHAAHGARRSARPARACAEGDRAVFRDRGHDDRQAIDHQGMGHCARDGKVPGAEPRLIGGPVLLAFPLKQKAAGDTPAAGRTVERYASLRMR